MHEFQMIYLGIQTPQTVRNRRPGAVITSSSPSIFSKRAEPPLPTEKSGSSARGSGSAEPEPLALVARLFSGVGGDGGFGSFAESAGLGNVDTAPGQQGNNPFLRKPLRGNLC